MQSQEADRYDDEARNARWEQEKKENLHRQPSDLGFLLETRFDRDLRNGQ